MSNCRVLPQFASLKPANREEESAAVANKQNSNHFKNPSCKDATCRVLPHFAQGSARAHSAKKSGKNPEMRQIEANRGRQT